MPEEMVSKARAASLLGLEAFDLDTGRCIGLVKDVVIGPADRVTHLGISPKAWFRAGFGVALEEVESVDNQRLNLRDPARVHFTELTGKENLLASRGEPFSRAVVSESGTNLGVLVDYAFRIPSGDDEEHPGALAELVTRMNGREHLFRVENLHSIGEDALVITPDSRHGEQIERLKQESESGDDSRLEKVESPDDERGSPARAFQERKENWLRGRRAPRDIKTEDGEVLVAEDEDFTEEILTELAERDLLNAVFFEATLLSEEDSPGETKGA